MQVRAIDLPFLDADVPRWWLHGNPGLTHFANGLNLLFAPGERFFIRSVKRYADRIEDPELLRRMKIFYGQEGRHGHEHERANRMLRQQGYEIDRFLETYDRLAFNGLEKIMPDIIGLSTTVACEHFTATMAQRALSDGFLDGAHPVMAKLLRWHAAEEVEHKSVAFDVLKEVDPRYFVRVLGLIVATTQLIAWWMKASRMLRDQEDLTPEEWRTYGQQARQLTDARRPEDIVALFRRAIRDYLRPDFHPDQVTHDREAAERFLDHLETRTDRAA